MNNDSTVTDRAKFDAIMPPIRVGIDITYAGTREGTGTYIRNLLNELAQYPEFEWITFVRPRPGMLRRLPRPLRRVMTGIASIVWLQFVLPLNARRQRLDIFHAPAFIAPLFLPCPLVVTLLDASQYTLPEQEDRLWSLYVRAFASLASRRAARVIAISNYAASGLQRFFNVPHCKLAVTPLGVSTEFRMLPPGEAAAIVAQYGVSAPYILFVGAGDARKNYRTLLAALRHLRSQGIACPPLAVVGKPNAEFKQLADEVSGALDIRFLGYVPTRALVALYNCASVFAYPSQYEGFGLPVLEAMACGCPVVCADTTSIPEVAGDAALLVNPTDPGALAAALNTVLVDSAHAARLASRGLVRASMFRWANTAAATLAVYRELCYKLDKSVACGTIVDNPDSRE